VRAMSWNSPRDSVTVVREAGAIIEDTSVPSLSPGVVPSSAGVT
jgi:hypothetical protein